MTDPLISYTPTTDREDLAEEIGLLMERETPWLDMIMNGGRAFFNTEYSWVNTDLSGFRDLVSTAISSTGTSLSLAGSYQGMTTKIRPNTLLRIGDETLRVTAGTSSPFTVVRGYEASSAEAHAVGAVVTIVSSPVPEADTSFYDSGELGSKSSNYTQIFRDTYRISGTAEFLKLPGQEQQPTKQLERIMKKLLKQLEVAALYGVKQSDSNNSIPRSMDGLCSFIPSANVTNAAGAALDTDFIDALVRNALFKGAEVDTLLVSNVQKSKFDAMKIARVNSAQPQKDKTINNLVDTYESNCGPLRIVPSNNIRDDELFLVKKENFIVAPAQGRRFAMEKLAKVGDRTDFHIVGEYGMIAYSPKIAFRVHSLATA